MIIDAVRDGRDRVFCPEQTTRAAYDNPAALRARIVVDVQRLLNDNAGMPDELLDTLVLGADHPMITAAREQWEREHAGAP